MNARRGSRGLIAATTLAAGLLYTATVAIGLHLARNSSASQRHSASERALIATGSNIFDFTALYAPRYTTAGLSCGSCHAASGRQPTAAPMTGVTGRFPQFSVRAARVITLHDRIRECFVRSENGQPPADDSDVMKALVAYLSSASETQPVSREKVAGLPKLRPMKPDPAAGQGLYVTQCAGCHGDHGQGGGGGQWPPLWGSQSFNDGAGMNQIPKLAAFIAFNMPQNRKGSLSPQQAWDLAAFVHAQPRPAMNPAFAKF